MQGLYADQAWQPTELERDALQKLRDGLSTARGGPLRAFTSVKDVFKDVHSDAPQGKLHPDCPLSTDQAHHTLLTKAGSRETSKPAGAIRAACIAVALSNNNQHYALLKTATCYMTAICWNARPFSTGHTRGCKCAKDNPRMCRCS